MGIDSPKYKCYPRDHAVSIMKRTPKKLTMSQPDAHDEELHKHRVGMGQPKVKTMPLHKRQPIIKYKRDTRQKMEKIMKTLQHLKKKQNWKQAEHVKKPILDK